MLRSRPAVAPVFQFPLRLTGLRAAVTSTGRIALTDTAGREADQVTATLDQKAFGDAYATDDLGPGSVSLLTGNYSVSATDASIAAWGSDATISRTFNSLSATQSGIFGPGWQTSLAVEEADSEWTGLADTGSGVVLTDVDGGLAVFAKSASGYLAQGDAAGEGLALAKTASPDEFTITDLDGNQTTFAFTGTDLLGAMALERMLAGLSTREDRVGLEPVGAAVTERARATSRSAAGPPVRGPHPDGPGRAVGRGPVGHRPGRDPGRWGELRRAAVRGRAGDRHQRAQASGGLASTGGIAIAMSVDTYIDHAIGQPIEPATGLTTMRPTGALTVACVAFE